MQRSALCTCLSTTTEKQSAESNKLREEVPLDHSSCPQKSVTSGMSYSLKVMGSDARTKKCVQPAVKNALFSFSCNPGWDLAGQISLSSSS